MIKRLKPYKTAISLGTTILLIVLFYRNLAYPHPLATLLLILAMILSMFDAFSDIKETIRKLKEENK